MLARYAEQDKLIKPAVHRAVMHEARPWAPPLQHNIIHRSIDGGIWLSHGQPAL